MALGAKYENTYTGESGNQYKWQILEQGGSGATPLVAAGRDFIRTTYRASDDNEYSPMIVSETTISLFDENGVLYDDMVELLADNVEDRYFLRIIDVTDSNQVKWIGPIKRGRVSRSEEGAKVITLTAFDGLDLLQKRTFTSTLSTILGSVETLYSGRATYTSLVATVLGKIGLGLDVYIASKHYPRLQGAALAANGGAQLDAADNPWDNVYADRSNYRAKSEKAGADDRPIYCSVVLEDILRTWGCTLYQHNGAWRIVQVNLRGNSSIRWWRYDSAGSAVGSPNYADETGHVYVPTAESLERTPSSLTQLDAYDAAAVTFGHGEYRFMPNPGLDIESSGIFSYEPKGWTLVGYAGARYENIGNGDGQLICDTVQVSNPANMPTTAVGTGAGTIDAFVNKYCDSSTGFADADTLKEIATGDGTGTVSGTLSLLNINEYTGNYIASGEQLYLNAAGGTSAAITLTSALKPGDTVVTFSPVAGIILADSISGKKSGYAYSTSRYEIGSGEKFNLYAQFFASLKDGKAPIFLGGSGRKREMYFQVKLSGSSGDRYLTETTGSDTRLTWGSTVAWIARNTNAYDWNNITESITDETPFAGTITIKIGVSAEYKGVASWAIQNNSFSMDEIRLDNVDVRPLLAPLTPNAESTSTVVYDSTQATEVARIRELSVRIGDFPFMPVDAGMSLDSDGYIETGDWEEAPITGAASGVSHEQLLAKVILRSIRAPREVHSAEYYGASRVFTPWDVVQRGGSEWAPMSLVISWNREKTEGEWYKVTESGFVDESTIIKNGAALVSTKGGVGAAMAGFMLNAGAAMFADGSAAITRTTAEISAGTVTSISVESITEPIFKAGDLITIVAPDLSFYQARISADQDALATSLSIEDKDNPGTGVTFTNDVGYPAAVYFLEQELLTLARLGEQGFAVTVLGDYLGRVDGVQSGPFLAGDPITVKNWTTSLEPGTTVYITEEIPSAGEQIFSVAVYGDAGLTTGVKRGATQIFLGAGTSLSFQNNQPIKPAGSTPRADFQVGYDAITAYVGSPGNIIGYLSTFFWGPDVGGPFTSNTYFTLSLATEALKDGDTVLFYTTSGSVIKGTIDGDAGAGLLTKLSAADGDITDSLSVGDAVTAGFVAGMRIDSNNIEFTADTVSSSNYSAGTNGWALFNDGSAEFNNVTVRGTIEITGASTGIGSFSDAGPLVTATNLDDVPNGTSFYRWAASGAPPTAAGTPSSSGLYLGSDYMGFFAAGTPGEWRTYMTSAGHFYLGGTSGKLIWNGSTLSIDGAVTISSASGFSGSGYLQVGSGTKDTDLSGFHFDSSEIVGQSGGADQVVLNTSGQIVAGSGKVTLDANGITVNAASGSSSMKFQVGGVDSMTIDAETTGSFDYTFIQANDYLILNATDPGAVYGTAQIVLSTGEVLGDTTPSVQISGAHMKVERGTFGLDRHVASNTSDVTVTNSTTETTVISTTVLADGIMGGNIIRVWASGTYGHTTSPASSMTLKVKVGGTTVATEQFYFPTGSGSSGFGWEAEFFVTMRSATSAIGSGRVVFEKSNLAGDQVQICNSGPTTVSSVTTNNTAVSMTMTWDVANASNTITAKAASISIQQPYALS